MKTHLSFGQCYKLLAIILLGLNINYAYSQNFSVCPVGVPIEPKGTQESLSTHHVEEVFFRPFLGWNNLQNIKYKDGATATTTLYGIKNSRAFKGDNFNFQIPKGATIDGISLCITGQSDRYEDIDEIEILLLDPLGEPKGQNKKNSNTSKRAWQADSAGRDRTWCYGSSSDHWGTQWTPEEINSRYFGYQIQLRTRAQDTVNISIDNIELVVHYTPAYSFCEGKCLTFFIDKYEEFGSYVWRYPEGFRMVSRSTKDQTIDLDILEADFGLYQICVDVFDYNGLFVETCCRKFLYQDCNASEISGVAWSDHNDNTLRDNDDGLVPNVSVKLFNELSYLIAETVTDTNGEYSFKNLAHGKYFLKIDTLSDTRFVIFNNTNLDINSDIRGTMGSGTTDIIDVEIGRKYRNIDFGYQPMMQLGEFVWHDMNFNGLLDNDESGLSDIRVTLLKRDSTAVVTTWTDSLGYYSLRDIPANEYIVSFETPQGFYPTFKTQSQLMKVSKVNDKGFIPLKKYIERGDKLDLDAGFYQKVSMGYFSWEDLNGDGVFQTNEPPIGHVQVVLKGQEGRGTFFESEVTSDSTGRYQFMNLNPGNYHWEFVTPNGYRPTLSNKGDEATDSDPVNGKVENITLISGQSSPDYYAGFYRPISIGDFVWEDLNGNGIQENGEWGIAHIEVTLYELLDGDTLIVEDKVTDHDGNYMFQDKKPGFYFLQFEAQKEYSATLKKEGSDLLLDSDVSSSGLTELYLVKSGEMREDLDAGYFRSGQLGDFVWEDLNGNGLQDAGEPGMSDIKIVLSGETTTGSVIHRETTTDIMGNYLFTNVFPGTYQITVELPNGYDFTPSNQGADSHINSKGSNGVVSGIIITSGEKNVTIDLGMFRLSSIGNFVWEDLNGDGLQDTGEPGISDIKIVLSGTTTTGIVIYRETTTDADGHYQLDSVFTGNYTIRLEIPQGFAPTLSQSGNDISNDSNLSESSDEINLTLATYGDRKDIDIGLIRLSAIGDLVYEDENCNGTKEGIEKGLFGIKLSLTGMNHLGALIDLNTWTDTSGNYLFQNLRPGFYQINVELPNGFEMSSAFINQINLFSGQDILNIDVPLFRRASIGDFVWEDTNKNGIQDDGEPGIGQVKVTLRSQGMANFQELTTETDASGFYKISGIKPGVFDIAFGIPNGYTPTEKNKGVDKTRDSDIQEDGLIRNISIVSGRDDRAVDAGFFYVPNATIGDVVWEDLNGNGIQDANETGIGFVDVTLIGTTFYGQDIVNQTQTNGDGLYLFEKVEAGTYKVEFGLPEGYVFTTPFVGNSDLDSDVQLSKGSTNIFAIARGQTKLDIDAGMYRYGAIGDYVWLDTNNDGLQDIDEQGIEGVPLDIRNSSGDIIETTKTNDKGYYLFSNLTPGDYFVETTLPSAFSLTIQNNFDTVRNSKFELIKGVPRTALFSLNSGQIYDNIDLGLISTLANVSGLTWFDENGDGLEDWEESRIENIEVHLIDNAGDTILMTLTDSDGYYEFNNVVPGSYKLGFEVLQDSTFTKDNTDLNSLMGSQVIFWEKGLTNDFEVSAGQSLKNINAGYVEFSIIGDHAWRDDNKNGIQDPEEIGINGLKVWLLDAKGVVWDSTITQSLSGQPGHYSFNRLRWGSYKVMFEIQDTFEFTTRVLTQELINSDVAYLENGLTEDFIVLPNQNRTDIDAGYILSKSFTGSLSGIVWRDKNNDKLRGMEDTVLVDITLQLFDHNGLLVASTSSDNQGNYSFDNLTSGNYYIKAPVISDYLYITFSSAPPFTDSQITNEYGEGTTRTIAVSSGGTIDNFDIGYAQSVTISGKAWADINNDGWLDFDEPLLPNVFIELINEKGTVEKSVETQREGSYLFENVAGGKYRLRFSDLSGYLFAINNSMDSSRNSLPNQNTGETDLLDFSQSTQYINNNVGYVRAGRIGRRIWLDLDGNGIYQTNEPGVSNIKVMLFAENGTAIDSTFSGRDGGQNFEGFYEFSKVRPGNYFLKFEAPTEYSLTSANIGNPLFDSDVTEANGPLTTSTFTIHVGEEKLSVDAGIFIPGIIGDKVWNDLNKNGVQDAGEPGLAGVSVHLFNESGILLDTQVSDDDGLYSFGGLIEGDYYLQFDLLDSFQYSSQYRGSNNQMDSDVDPTGTSPLILLSHGMRISDLDVGMYVSDLRFVVGNIWEDTNEDGIRTYNEQLQQQVQVYLLDNQFRIISQTETNFAGRYILSNKGVEGDYYVFVEKPEDYIFTLSDVGQDRLFQSHVNVAGYSDLLSLRKNNANTRINAGYYYKIISSIAGRVWKDLNNNNFLDNTDEGLSNVVIFLFNKDRMFIKSARTNEQGQYSLTDLDAGEYYCLLPEFPDLTYILYSAGQARNDSEFTNQFGQATSRLLSVREGEIFQNFNFGYRKKSNFNERTVFEDIKAIDIELFPNPSMSDIHIFITNNIEEDAPYLIFNSTGNMVMEGCLMDSKVCLNLEHLPSGLYTLYVIDGDKISKKMISRVKSW